MRRLPFASLLVPALLLSTLAVPVAASTASLHRFSARTFQTGHQPVVVGVRGDVFAVRFEAVADGDVGRFVDELLQKVDHLNRITGTWVLTSDDLIALTPEQELTPAQLAALADAVENEGGHLWPALTRENTGRYNRAFSDDKLVVTTKEGELDAVLAKIGAHVGGVVVEQSRWLKNTAVVRVGAAAHFDAVNAAALVAAAGIDGVVSAEPNLYRELEQLSTTVNDPIFPQQWHLMRNASQNVPGADSEFGGSIHADLAWDVTKGDPDVVVAVYDSGNDWQHPDLVDHVRQDLMFDPSANDLDPSAECEASQDGIDVSPNCPDSAPFRESHSTAVAGVIAASGDNNIGVTGVCPQCMLMPVRLLGTQTNSSLGIAESFVRGCDPDNDGSGDGAWIINNSWGPGLSLFFPLSESERQAFDLCRDVGRHGKGTVITFATGNETSNVSADAYAKHPYVIGVAASSNLDDWAPYSNFGEEVDIAAPSLGGIVAEDNFGIVTTDVRGPEGYSIDAGAFDVDYTTDFSGTSAACPVVSGLAGLILSANPDLSAEQVRLILTSTADKIRADKVPWEQFFGQDLEAAFDYDDVGHSVAFGYGRVNAGRAVALAADPVLLQATLGDAGVRCDDADAAGAPCAFCSPEGVCLNACTAQSDCDDGSVCNVELGACELPRVGHTDFLEPCNADCAYCVGTVDTQFVPTSICSKPCTTDASCDPRCADGDPECTTDAFDCRPISDDPAGASICAVGSPDSGGPADFGACGFNQVIGLPTLVLSDDGKELCGETCFADGPGACPWGFHCSSVACDCTRESQNGNCRELTCFESENDELGVPLCVPDPGHADVCKSDLDCQRGDYCFVADASAPAGECRFDDRAGCDICEACTDSTECAGRGTCLGATQSDLGVCTVACDDGEACPNGSTCRTVSVESFGGRLRQFQACLGDGGDAGNFDTPPQDACAGFTCDVPACRDDIPCGAGESCVDGGCVDDVVAEGEGEGADDEGLTLSGGGARCGGCSGSGADVGVSGLAFALLAFVRRRR